MTPTIRQLQYLLALMDERHFGRAADRCYVTQSTFSAGISELERLLGVTLFERTKRKVMPTPLAFDIAERARRVMLEAEAIVEVAKSQTEGLSGPLRLGLIPTIGPFLLPQVEAAIRDAFPALKLYLREDQTARLLDQLAVGELDALILAFPYDAPGTEHVLFGEDPMWLVCPPDHPLAQQSVISVDQVPREDLLLLEDGHCLRDHALAACHLALGARSGAVQGTSLYTLVQMVANGLGVTMVPQIAVDSPMFATCDVTFRPLSADSAPRYLGLTWRSTTAREAAFHDFAKVLERALAG